MNKRGVTLIELVATAPIAIILIVSISALLLVVLTGFKNVSTEFSDNMQAVVAREIFEQQLPDSYYLSFDTPVSGCNAITSENGKYYYINNYQMPNETKNELDNVNRIYVTVDMAGERCRLNYELLNNSETLKGSVVLLNMPKATFEALNDAIIPLSREISSMYFNNE